jgi:hypothetical protein
MNPWWEILLYAGSSASFFLLFGGALAWAKGDKLAKGALNGLLMYATLLVAGASGMSVMFLLLSRVPDTIAVVLGVAASFVSLVLLIVQTARWNARKRPVASS